MALLPRPTPHSPPVASAYMPRMAWKPPSVGSANGSRKAVMRAMR
jgi:hypothetical protein